MDPMNRSLLERITLLEKKVDLICQKLNIDEVPIKPVQSTSDSFELNDHKFSQINTSTTHHISKNNKSLNLLPILAVICFGMAAIFMVKLAVESGWLNPLRQWGLLSLFGVTLCAFGILIEKVDKQYRSYAASAGIITLYLSAYSGFLYFNLFSPMTSLVLGGSVSLFCFYLFNYYKEESFILISAIGTYISPVLLGKEGDLLFISGYFLIWSGIFSISASYLRTRSLTLIGSYLSLSIFLFLNLRYKDPDSILIIILVQCTQFITYASGILNFSLKEKIVLNYRESMTYLPVLLFFYGTIFYLLNIYNAEIAPWISLGFSAFIFLLYKKAKSQLLNLESHDMVYAFMGIVIFHSGYLQLIPASSKPWLLPLILLGIYIRDQRNIAPNLSKFFYFLFTSISIIEFFKLSYNLINEANTKSILPSLITVLLGFLYYSKCSKNIKDKESLFLNLINILCVLILYRIGFNYGSLAVSFLWGLYSFTILIIGYFKKNVVMAKSSLIVLTITTLKALVYDINSAPSLIRISSLVLTGVVLYGAGYLFKKINNWQ